MNESVKKRKQNNTGIPTFNFTSTNNMFTRGQLNIN